MEELIIPYPIELSTAYTFSELSYAQHAHSLYTECMGYRLQPVDNCLKWLRYDILPVDKPVNNLWITLSKGTPGLHLMLYLHTLVAGPNPKKKVKERF